MFAAGVQIVGLVVVNMVAQFKDQKFTVASELNKKTEEVTAARVSARSSAVSSNANDNESDRDSDKLSVDSGTPRKPLLDKDSSTKEIKEKDEQL